MSHDPFIRRYLADTQTLLSQLEDTLVARLNVLLPYFLTAWRQGRTIFLVGNGGSAATASHFANDLAKWTIREGKPRVRAIALTDNVPLMLAWANDTAYENIFVEQLKNLLQPGDIVVGFSGSGNSMNVVRAMEYANEQGVLTVGFVGYDGGKLVACARETIHVPVRDMQHSENLHQIIFHLFTELLAREIEREPLRTPRSE